MNLFTSTPTIGSRITNGAASGAGFALGSLGIAAIYTLGAMAVSAIADALSDSATDEEKAAFFAAHRGTIPQGYEGAVPADVIDAWAKAQREAKAEAKSEAEAKDEAEAKSEAEAKDEAKAKAA